MTIAGRYVNKDRLTILLSYIAISSIGLYFSYEKEMSPIGSDGTTWINETWIIKDTIFVKIDDSRSHLFNEYVQNNHSQNVLWSAFVGHLKNNLDHVTNNKIYHCTIAHK